MKPIIGVTPDFNAGDRKEWGGKEPTYFLRARYIRAIEDLGGVPLILPLASDRAVRRLVDFRMVEPPALHGVHAGLEGMRAGHIGHREPLVRREAAPIFRHICTGNAGNTNSGL